MSHYLELPAFCVSGVVLLYGSMRATRDLGRFSIFHWLSAGLSVFYVCILLVQQAFGFANCINSDLRYLCFLAMGVFLLQLVPVEIEKSAAQPIQGVKVDWRAIAMALIYPACCVLFNGLKAGLLEPPVDVDSVVYHLPIPVRMLQTGSLTNNDASYWFFPAHSELIVHWLIKPMHNDVLASLQNLLPAFMFLCCIAAFIWSFTRSTSLAIGMALCTACYFHHVRRQFYSQENDLLLAAFWLVALQMLLVWLDTKKFAHLLISGAAIGVVLGTKYSGVYYLGAYGFLLGCALFGAGQFRLQAYLRLALFVSLTALLVGGGWYLRNWIVTGSPMYPKDFGIFQTAGNADALTKSHSGIQSTVFYYLNSLETYRLLLIALHGFGGLFGFVAVLVLPVSLFVALRMNKRLKLFWVAAVFFALLGPLISPLSAEIIPGTLNMLKFGGAPMRYSLPFLALSVVFAGAVIHGIRQIQGNFPADAVIGVIIASVPLARELNYVGGSSLIAILTLSVLASFSLVYLKYYTWLQSLRTRTVPRLVMPLLIICATAMGLAFAAIGPRLQSKRIEKRNEIYVAQYFKGGKRSTQLFAWCDQHLKNTSVGMAGALVYPFFGPELSNQARRVEFQNILQGDVHDSVLPRYLVVTRIFGEPEFSSNAGMFPPQKDQIDRQPKRFRVVFHDDFASVYEVLGANPTSMQQEPLD